MVGVFFQGMHELLAGLYLTVSSDVADPTEPETKEFPEIMLTVLDRQYVAHDAYALFCVVMETASGWFAQTKEEVKDNRRLTDDAIAFQKASALDDTTSIIMYRTKFCILRRQVYHIFFIISP